MMVHYTGPLHPELPFRILLSALAMPPVTPQETKIGRFSSVPAGVWVDSWTHATVQNSSIAV
jgi:hypothetical protein